MMSESNKLHILKLFIVFLFTLAFCNVSAQSPSTETRIDSTLLVNPAQINEHKTSKINGTFYHPEILVSEALDLKIPYWTYVPFKDKKMNNLPVIYVNDGQAFVHRAKMAELLDSLIHTGQIEPVVAVFIDPRNPEDSEDNRRRFLFNCNPDFVSFFISELMPTIEKYYPVSTLSENTAIFGLSLGGLCASYLGLERPDRFGKIGMLSPYFNGCRAIYHKYEIAEKQSLNMFMTYGTGKDVEKQCLRMLEILNSKNYDVMLKVKQGGNHDWEMWEGQLNDMILHFFKRSE